MGLRARHKLPLCTSLPPLRNLSNLTPIDISCALHLLRDLFCPLRPYIDLDFGSSIGSGTQVPDSGYVSADEDDIVSEIDADAASLDPIERAFAIQWLIGFIGRASEFSLGVAENGNDDACCESFVNVACSILTYLTGAEDDADTDDDGPEGHGNGDFNRGKDGPGMMRRFEFDLPVSGIVQEQLLSAELHDTPMQTGRDHTDVGLQTWGASIVFSRKMCKDPAAFGLRGDRIESGTSIIELGAGTGLVSLVLASLLPQVTQTRPSIIATDYHPAVLKNLELNAAAHFEKQPRAAPIKVCHLDWSAPKRDAPLDVPAKIIVAADVAYAPEHAIWLRDCAAQLLAPDGIFWLMVSIRPNGKFAGISDVVEGAFNMANAERDGRVLKIFGTESIDKLDGIGRADEVAYKLYKVMWA